MLQNIDNPLTFHRCSIQGDSISTSPFLPCYSDRHPNIPKAERKSRSSSDQNLENNVAYLQVTCNKDKLKKEISVMRKSQGGNDNLGFDGPESNTQGESVEPEMIVKSYIYGTETLKNDQCSASYQIILTNFAFIRLFVMMMLALPSQCLGTLYLMPPLARERGASEVTASLTVTISGATEQQFPGAHT